MEPTAGDREAMDGTAYTNWPSTSTLSSVMYLPAVLAALHSILTSCCP